MVDSIGDGDPDRPLSMSLINAIPTWREPVLKAGGKWDEVRRCIYVPEGLVSNIRLHLGHFTGCRKTHGT
jgi:hypothetical protein